MTLCNRLSALLGLTYFLVLLTTISPHHRGGGHFSSLLDPSRLRSLLQQGTQGARLLAATPCPGDRPAPHHVSCRAPSAERMRVKPRGGHLSWHPRAHCGPGHRRQVCRAATARGGGARAVEPWDEPSSAKPPFGRIVAVERNNNNNSNNNNSNNNNSNNNNSLALAQGGG
jgi:hypothetical protein